MSLAIHQSALRSLEFHLSGHVVGFRFQRPSPDGNSWREERSKTRFRLLCAARSAKRRFGMNVRTSMTACRRHDGMIAANTGNLHSEPPELILPTVFSGALLDTMTAGRIQRFEDFLQRHGKAVRRRALKRHLRSIREFVAGVPQQKMRCDSQIAVPRRNAAAIRHLNVRIRPSFIGLGWNASQRQIDNASCACHEKGNGQIKKIFGAEGREMSKAGILIMI